MNDYSKQRLPEFLYKGASALSHGGGKVSWWQPKVSWGRFVLPDLVQYDPQRQRLKVLHDAGFFSICTVTLQNLTVLYPINNYIEVIWATQKTWRDVNGSCENLFNDYFEPKRPSSARRFRFVAPFDHHGFYEDLNFKKLNTYIHNYFSPSSVVKNRIQHFCSKYNICAEKTIGVCYRGTDKVLEVPTISPTRYLSEVRELLRKHNDLRVLVQTDQRQVRDDLLRAIGPAAFYIEEMPVTDSSSAVHLIAEKAISNFQLGVNLLAVVKILAQCKYVVTHTGNVSLWIFLFRGSARNCCQLRPGAVDGPKCYDGDRSLRQTLKRWTRRIGLSSDDLHKGSG